MLNAPQLILDWATPVAPAFDNFLPGDNEEVVAHVRRFASGTLRATSMLLWGAPGSGRTHLLRAAVVEAGFVGRDAQLIEIIPERASKDALYALDDVDQLDAGAQGRLFTFYNACREAGAQLLLTAAVPAARAPLRDDLRTRIGAGLILEVKPLADADKPAALAGYARQHGFHLGDDVIAYLLTRGRRDMGALIAHIQALDRYSLAMKRPVTVPLVRELLADHP